MSEPQTDISYQAAPAPYSTEQIAQLTQAILGRAVALEADYVFLEPGPDALRLGFETPIGTQLEPALPADLTEAVVACFKAYAGLPTQSEDTGRRLQTGRFRRRIAGQIYRCEVTFLPLNQTEVMGITLSTAPAIQTQRKRRTGLLDQAKLWFKQDKKA